MDNQHLIGQVMLDKVDGSAVVIMSVTERDYGSVARVSESFEIFKTPNTISYYLPLSQLTTSPALVSQCVG